MRARHERSPTIGSYHDTECWYSRNHSHLDLGEWMPNQHKLSTSPLWRNAQTCCGRRADCINYEKRRWSVILLRFWQQRVISWFLMAYSGAKQQNMTTSTWWCQWPTCGGVPCFIWDAKPWSTPQAALWGGLLDKPLLQWLGWHLTRSSQALRKW